MNSFAFDIESVPTACMEEVAKRARVATEQLRIKTPSFQGMPKVISSDHIGEPSDNAMIGYYQFGIRALANAILGSTINAADDTTTMPDVQLEAIHQLAIAKRLATADKEWDVPVVEHTWTPESFRIRMMVKEFSEATHADY